MDMRPMDTDPRIKGREAMKKEILSWLREQQRRRPGTDLIQFIIDSVEKMT